MNLISCFKCAIVLDVSRMKEPEMYPDEDMVPDLDKSVWLDRGYVPAIKCPVCGAKIAFSSGDSDEA